MYCQDVYHQCNRDSSSAFLCPSKVSELNESVNALIMLGVIPIMNSKFISFYSHIVCRCSSPSMYNYLMTCSDYGKAGIPIPAVDGVSFKNATLQLGDVSTDMLSIRFAL